MKEITEFNEFTWDMIRALPRAYYQHSIGNKISVRCKPGLGELYYFADEVVEVDRFNAINDKLSYNKNAPDYALNEWLAPPLKDKYKNHIKFNKPTVIIQNKYALEWSTGVYNYFSTDVLGELFDLLKSDYDIVYIRPRGDDKNYYKDENEIKPFEDYEYIKNNHPYVHTIEQLKLQYPEYSYNIIQMMVHSTADKHISVSGGNACLAAYFGGDLIIFDSLLGSGAGRGVWKTDSWLKGLGGSNIYGVNTYKELINKVKDIMCFKWDIYNTDKIRGHGYETIFNKYLNREKQTIVEFGCRLGSAKMWCDYFSSANVYGCDIVPFIYDNDRFKFLNFDMTQNKSYDKLPDNIDVIIEDGPHTSKSQMIMLSNCIDKMNKNGVIIFEDLHCTDKSEEPNFSKFKGDSDITLNEMFMEWDQGIFKDYKYIKGSKFKDKNIKINITRGEKNRWDYQTRPSEVVILEIL